MKELIVSGVDVSNAQGVLTANHWATLRKTHEFAIIKCGNGNDGHDSMYSKNLLEARRAGLTVGTYHFVYVLPDKAGKPGRSPEEQAEAHYRQATYNAGDLIPWADVEWPPPVEWDKWELPNEGRSDFIADFILRYVDHYQRLSGLIMGFYSFPNWIEEARLASSSRSAEFNHLPFWRAGSLAQKPVVVPGPVAPWTHCDIAQWTGGKFIMPNGTRGDGNICLKSILELLSVAATRQ